MTNNINLHHGDCLEVLRGMPDNSVDSIVTDPPYGLAFMGKRWDYDVPSVEIWAECLRVLKPGGHLLAFAGTRTQHRMAVRIEDAGFEIRDMIAWVYGSGFPKSLDVSKALDKAAGAEREVIGIKANYHSEGKRAGSGENMHGVVDGSFSNPEAAAQITAPATDAARQWQGWGTSLKPSLEPVTVARKPLIGTVAENVLAHGTGALNIDGCRVETSEALGRFNNARTGGTSYVVQREAALIDNSGGLGRWPANLIHSGDDEVTDLLGSAARFFYCAKASKRDRDEGLEGFEVKYTARDNGFSDKLSNSNRPRANIHPTVKPTDLMAYLVRLVTPPGGTVLDPFMGSGSTGKAAMREGLRFVGIEREAQYMDIARARIYGAVPAACDLFSASNKPSREAA